MRIAVVGGGFTGLTAAYELTKRGHEVTVFEKEDHLGGLAWGFKEPGWEWSLEASYHHLFTNDRAIVSLIHELGLSGKIIKKRPITANYWGGQAYQFDNPIHLLTFPGLSLIDKLRTGALAAFCKLYPFWQTLEGVTAKQFFTTWGGKAGWEEIWEPLMTGKFGHFDNEIAASWLWARIKKRTPSLYYIEGGFQTLVNALAAATRKNGGVIRLKTEATKQITSQFDKVLFTTPTPIAHKLIPTIPNPPIPHLSAQTLILETDTPILNNIYWLNITDRKFPFLAVVTHTNFMDKRHYGNRHLTYVGNYLPPDHPYLFMTKEQLLKIFLPFIKRISFDSRFSILNSRLFVAPFAQPVHQINYSRRAPKFETGAENMYLANMDSIYPWDRGTNYAVELGQKAAMKILALGVS